MEQKPLKRGYLYEDFRLFHIKDSLGTDVEMHYHEFFKLLLLLSGTGSYIIEGRRYELRPRDIVLVGQHIPHKPEFASGVLYERYIFFISSDFLNRYSTEDCSLEEIFRNPNGPVYRPSPPMSDKLFALVGAAEQELKGNAYGNSVLSRFYLARLLAELGRQRSFSTAAAVAPVRSRGDKMLELLRYIDAHINEEITIENLAERFYLSQYHMMRRFREEVGVPIHVYISERRLLNARAMIEGGASATEACFASGYGSYSAFARAYKKHFRCSPMKGSPEVSENTDYTE